MKETLLLSLLEKIVNRQFLFVLFSIFLFPGFSNAQGVQTVQVGGTTRQMLVFASGVDPGRPLVISMHGLNQTMYSQYQTGFETIAAANNFVLVYPQAINNSWQLSGTGDTDFILAIIDQMSTTYGIDRDRVYLHGFSMGGMMTYYAATKIADKIAAFGPVSGYLLGGANTNSSRPIPIIHAHGINDGYVSYSNVQTSCLDPWIARNGCPTTPQITAPYPADNSSPGSSKKYWGPGKDGVEIVFLSLGGVGHNYSNSPINTSQEIWNFFNKYSLKYGLSEFRYASVTDSDPKQIKVIMTAPIADSVHFNGFTVKVDNVVVPVDSVVLTDSTDLSIFLSDSILMENTITLSYSNGNLFSSVGKAVHAFGDTLVNNLLLGSSPVLLEVTTNKTGDTLMARFNKKMLIPSDISTLMLNADFNGPISVSILQCSFLNNDSTVLAFSLDTVVYRDYHLSFTYPDSSIASADSGMLKPVTDFPVNNVSDGLPVHIVSAKVKSDGITLLLEFQKPMALKASQYTYLYFYINGTRLLLNNASILNDTIQFTLSKSVHYGDVVKISYTPGDIKAADNGPLQGFSNFASANEVIAPVWIQIPGKVEAENFTLKSGMQTEATSDVGGGLNLGYINDGNWAEYAIENNTSQTQYQIAFRIAAASTGGVIFYYLDGMLVDFFSCPSTGNWQVYTSVVKNISIPLGKHYLKFVASKAGFNINYMNITAVVTGTTAQITGANPITIHPNPASDELIINSAGFKATRIDIFDVTGNQVLSQSVAGDYILNIPVHLPDGMYFVKVGNETQYELKKIIITNK